MTASRLRALRAAILTDDDRPAAARAYVDAVGKAPAAERLLAHLADALGRRYSGDELDRIQDAVDEARAGECEGAADCGCGHLLTSHEPGDYDEHGRMVDPICAVGRCAGECGPP